MAGFVVYNSNPVSIKFLKRWAVAGHDLSGIPRADIGRGSSSSDAIRATRMFFSASSLRPRMIFRSSMLPAVAKPAATTSLSIPSKSFGIIHDSSLDR